MNDRPSSLSPNVQIVGHPVVSHLLATLRDQMTEPEQFRRLMRAVGFMLGYEATRTLPTADATVDTPLETCPARQIAPTVTIVPILRAGLGLADGLIDLLPEARVAHVGLYRDEDQLVPVWYYKRIPADIAEGPVIIVDPMLATGGSVEAVLELLTSSGCTKLRLVCLVAAPEGIERVLRQSPNLQITTAAVDRKLDHRGYILPGLGDAGDRLYGTT